MFSRRKGQGAAGPAAFIGIVTLFIILWILFLPPAERQQVLNNQTTAVAGLENARLLLQEYPKTIYVNQQSEFDHRIDSANLYVVNRDQVLTQRDAVMVQKATKSQGPFQIAFHVDNPANVVSAQLAFAVQSHSGNLIVLLNGQEIFNGEITAANPPPIRLDGLKQDNILEFRVSDPGWEFWKVNYYQLQNVRVLASIQDTSNRQASSQFSVTYDPQNVDHVQLRFVPECAQNNVGRITVTINNQVVVAKTPECGTPQIVEFDPSLLTKGTNIITMTSATGAVLMDNVMISSYMKTPVFPIYYFDVNQSMLDAMNSGEKDFVLGLTFAGDGQKMGTISINNRKLSFDQQTNSLSRKINPYVIANTNFIQIIPEQTLSVPEMTVSYADHTS